MKRVTAIILAVVIVCSLAACGSEPTGEQEAANSYGRYAEIEVPLPDELQEGDIFQMSKEDENPVFYLRKEEQGMYTIHKYILKDNVASEVTPEWLSKVTYSSENYSSEHVLEGNPSYFFYTTEDSEYNYCGYLLKENGADVIDITPASWTTPDVEGGYCIFPNQLTVLSSGNIGANSYGEISILDSNGMPIKEGKPGSDMLEGIMTYKDGFAVMNMGDSYDLKGILTYKDGETKADKEYKYKQTLEGNPQMDVSTDGELVMSCGDGIFKLNDKEEFEMVADGKMTSLSDLDMYPQSMLAMKDDTYYILYGNMMNVKQLMKYVYDPTLPTTPEHELTVYTLRQSFSLQQAAVKFKKSHPDTVVTVVVGLDEKDTGEKDEADAISGLLTKMIAGESTDVIIMDGLPIDSFVEKGLFSDLSPLVDPMEENGELYTNVCELYRQADHTLPVIPARFGTTMLVGKTLDVTKTPDVHSFAEAMKLESEPILGTLTVNDLVDQYLPFVMEDMIQNQELNEELLAQTLLDLKNIAGKAEIVDDYGNNKYAYGIWDIGYKGNLAFHETDGFAESMFPLAARKLVNGSYTFFGNAYKPSLQVAICATSKQQELAAEFVQSMLQEETQSSELYEGFPVNRAAMENLKTMDRSGYTAYTDIQVGEDDYSMFEVMDFTEEEAQNLVDMCETLDTCYKVDAKISEEVKIVMPRYLEGTMTVEDAVSEVKKNVALYLAE